MLTLSYRNCVRLLRTVPICPKPRAIGLHNIPRKEPTLFVYNHVARRSEPVFLAVAAPPDPPIRFFIELTLVGQDLYERTEKDVRNSLFSPHLQEKMERRALTRRTMHGIASLLTRFLIAQMGRLNFIPVYLHDPPTREERIRKIRTNRQALESCLVSLAEKTPVAIAPSGGSTHEKADLLNIPTTVASLAETLHRRGQVLKIVPSIIKERPEINKDTYRKYVADRILPFRLWRRLLDGMKIKRYERPRLTVEFLPAVTFTPAKPTKADKLRFVQELQRALYEVLKRD
jgi:1-acyl-sn-glycerol-3-phosphate acyltransferase